MSYRIEITEYRETDKPEVEHVKLYDSDSIPEGKRQYGYAESPKNEIEQIAVLDLRVDDLDIDAVVLEILKHCTFNVEVGK